MAEAILIISPVPLFPAHAGNRRRMAGICKELMEEGFRLDFFYSGYEMELDGEHDRFFNGRVLEWRERANRPGGALQEARMRLDEILSGWGVALDRMHRRLSDGAQSARWNRSLKEYAGLRKRHLLRRQLPADPYHAVIVNYAVQTAFFSLFPPETVKILDTHDRLTDRYRLYLDRGVEPVRWHSLRRRDEQKALRRADRIWAITESEREYFQSLVPERTVSTLTHVTPYRPIPVRDEEKARNSVLMIGSANRINLDGLAWFLERVWPGVVRRAPGARLLVAGSICGDPEVRQRVDSSACPGSVELYGRYGSDEEIYSQADICINTMRFGTGLKIKTLEALSYGKVVVTTSEGASGLEKLEGEGMIRSDDPEEWIGILAGLLADPARRMDAGIRIGEALGRMYEANRAVLMETVDGLTRGESLKPASVT